MRELKLDITCECRGQMWPLDDGGYQCEDCGEIVEVHERTCGTIFEFLDENDFARLGDGAFAAGFPAGPGYYAKNADGLFVFDHEENLPTE